MSLAKNKTYVHTSSCTVPDVALEQRNVRLLMDVFRCTMWINRSLRQTRRQAVSRFGKCCRKTFYEIRRN